MNLTLNKLCRTCNEEKPLGGFSKNARAKDGLQSKCKACNAASQKAWAEANPEKIAASQKAYREANPEKIAADHKAWREANKEKAAASQKAWKDANPEKVAASDKAWREANKEKIAAHSATRRAAKLQRTPPWLTKEHHDQITSIYAERERITKATGIDHHVDHILPLQGKDVCGLHVPWNLRVITAEDNLSKSNKH